MAYDIPADLIELKAGFFATDARCVQLAEALPPAAIADDEAVQDVMEELRQARAERLALVQQIHRHAWWATVDNRNSADEALVKAARALTD